MQTYHFINNTTWHVFRGATWNSKFKQAVYSHQIKFTWHLFWFKRFSSCPLTFNSFFFNNKPSHIHIKLIKTKFIFVSSHSNSIYLAWNQFILIIYEPLHKFYLTSSYSTFPYVDPFQTIYFTSKLIKINSLTFQNHLLSSNHFNNLSFVFIWNQFLFHFISIPIQSNKSHFHLKRFHLI